MKKKLLLIFLSIIFCKTTKTQDLALQIAAYNRIKFRTQQQFHQLKRKLKLANIELKHDELTGSLYVQFNDGVHLELNNLKQEFKRLPIKMPNDTRKRN